MIKACAAAQGHNMAELSKCTYFDTLCSLLNKAKIEKKLKALYTYVMILQLTIPSFIAIETFV